MIFLLSSFVQKRKLRESRINFFKVAGKGEGEVEDEGGHLFPKRLTSSSIDSSFTGPYSSVLFPILWMHVDIVL